METIQWGYWQELQKMQFKSYYVVWKPLRLVQTTQQDIPFKSYYVVWKPKSDRDFCRGHFQFKSYYVVWKPVEHVKASCKFIGLNRTMQYGNYCMLLHFQRIIKV